MISFKRLNEKGTEYRLVFRNGKYIDIFLIPGTTLSNKFGIIISSIQKMSKVIGENFDKFIFSLLSNYQNCDSDENRYSFLHKNLSTIANYADFFVENNGVDYAEFANENKKSESSIFFDENEIKNIIKLSESLKIYSLCSNTEIGLSDKYHKKIYNEFIDILTVYSAISKIYESCNSLGLQYQNTIWYDYTNLSYYSFIKVMDAYATITSKALIVCSYEKNPIPFFIGIFNKTAEWKDKYKKDKIIYEDHESQNDRDDKFLFNERIHKDLKRKVENNLLNKFEQRSFSFLVDSHRYQTKEMPPIKSDILLKSRLNQIKHISPFWAFIIVPIFSKASGIHDDFLRKESPKRVAVMSFYLADLLRHLFNNKFIYLFSLAAYYPESEIPESTTYRLRNISHFINSTLGFSNDDLMRAAAPRINIVRIIEDFVGKMITSRVKYCNILTGQAKYGIDFKRIEVETINYLTRFFYGNLKTEIKGLEEYIRTAIK